MSCGSNLLDDHRPQHVPGLCDTVVEGQEGAQGRTDGQAVQKYLGNEFDKNI